MRIRIPWLIDVEMVSSAKEVELLFDHPSLDRGFDQDGPWFNRKLLRVLLSTFQADGKHLPGFRSRNDEDRQASQESLRLTLDKLAKSNVFDKAALHPAITYVAGHGSIDSAMEAICQVLAGVFNANFSSGQASHLWQDAQILQKSVQPLSLRGFLHRISGRDITAREAILKAVGDRPNGLHAIALTTDNIKETLLKMRELKVAGTENRAVNAQNPQGFWLLVRTAPENILRRVRATMSLPTSGNILTQKSLIILRPRRAQKSEPPLGFGFAQNAWSACPAASYVPALCWFIWQKANDDESGTDEKQTVA